MHRRRLLATTGSIVGAGVAGCLNAVIPSVGLGETVTSRFGEFSIDAVDVQQSAVTLPVGSTPTVQNDDERYLLIFAGSFPGDPGDVDIPRFQSEFDVQLRGSNDVTVPISERRAGTDVTELSHDFYLMFRFPLDRTGFGQASLRYRGQNRTHRWDLPDIVPDSVLSYLEDQPTFEVTDFEVPARASDSASVSVTVAETAGADLAEPEPFNVVLAAADTRQEPAYGIPLGGGETVTETFDVELGARRGQEEAVYLDWGADSRSQDVIVE
jgi:hypothetical protein